MLEMIKNFYAYNAWAMEILLKSLEQVTEEEYTALGCSGHGSIRDTLAHLMGTQWGWFSWFDGSQSAVESIALHITGEEIDTPEKAAEKWKAVHVQTNACLGILTEDNIRKEWSATLPNGFTMSLPLWQLLLHVANHGTHTRAQIIAAVRRLGHNPGIYELFRYALELKQ